MPTRARLSRQAGIDLADIWTFGAAKWSVMQADRYEDGLHAAIDLLAANPRMAPERGPIAGIRIHVYRAHLIVYAEARDGITVLRVLHGRSDWRMVLV